MRNRHIKPSLTSKPGSRSPVTYNAFHLYFFFNNQLRPGAELRGFGLSISGPVAPPLPLFRAHILILYIFYIQLRPGAELRGFGLSFCDSIVLFCGVAYRSNNYYYCCDWYTFIVGELGVCSVEGNVLSNPWSSIYTVDMRESGGMTSILTYIDTSPAPIGMSRRMSSDKSLPATAHISTKNHSGRIISGRFFSANRTSPPLTSFSDYFQAAADINPRQHYYRASTIPNGAVTRP